MPRALSRLLSAGLMLVCTAAVADCQHASTPTTTFDELLSLLDHRYYTTRKKAFERIEQLLPTLKDAELAKLAGFVVNDGFTDSQRWLEQAMKKYFVDLTKSSKATAACQLLRIRMIGDSGTTSLSFGFGSLKGQIPHENEQLQLFSVIQTTTLAFRGHLQIGDPEGALARLQDLKRLFSQLPDPQFKKLNLVTNGRTATKEDVLTRIDAAALLTEESTSEIKHKRTRK